MLTIPATIPAAPATVAGSSSVTADVDVGGYDFMVGGHGFRLATDQNFPYARATEPTTTHRYDSSLEPGEQSLSPLPWLKSQSSFHAGAGQLNLEQGFTAFQYQQEQIEHIRYDNSLGVDVWTPGQVTRLPDTRLFDFGFNASCMITATVNDIDYAVIGGEGSLYQVSWAAGPDADPTVAAVDLSGSEFGGASNCTITSLATDGTSYFALVQLTTVAIAADTLSYIISGPIGSTDPPFIVYKLSSSSAGAVRHNLCQGPSFETSSASIVGGGVTLTSSTDRAYIGTHSLKMAWTNGIGASSAGAIVTSLTPTAFKQYVFSAYVYVPSGSTPVLIAVKSDDGSSHFGPAANATDSWQRIWTTFTPQTTDTIYFEFWNENAVGTAGQVAYVDAVLIEQAYTLGAYFDGSTAADSNYTYAWDGTANASTSTATPKQVTVQLPGILGWVKERLIGALGPSVYELPPTTGGAASLPDPKYTHPVSSCTWTAISESPDSILIANLVGGQANILSFALDSSGGTPVLSGGATVASLPSGETIYTMQSYLASFLGIGTSQGVRVGSFDTYTGNLKLGPLSITTTSPVLTVAGRDRFIYAGYTNQQADGKTGLVRLDLSMIVDVAGRLAYAPDLRPPTTAPTGLGAVTGLGILPTSNRVVFVTPEGIHVEGDGPGVDGSAWLRTSRIRYDTAEMKLFKLGRIHGSLDVASIQVVGVAPYGVSQNLGTFGFIDGVDPGEFRLPGGLNEWIQLEFHLTGSACVLNSYQVKALPAPQRQHVITLTANCFTNETDRFGLDVTDPETPRQRYQNVVDLETAGDEVRFVEFTNTGSVAQLVVIDQIIFESFSRPSVDDDFGGYITFKLRTTEN